MEYIPPWTTTDCENCGQTGQATRSESKMGPYICSDCQLVERAEEEKDNLRREIAELKQLLGSMSIGVNTYMVSLPLKGSNNEIYVVAAGVVRIEPIKDAPPYEIGCVIVCSDGSRHAIALRQWEVKAKLFPTLTK